ncbi:MAG: hypothetical protein KDC08_02045 [Actinobacteria bacterium]|nr:hypothetical protein [Actinomycetota bacterium]
MRLGRFATALTAVTVTATLLTPSLATADIGQNQNTKAAANWGRIDVQWDWSMPASMTDNDQYPGIPDEPMQPVPGYQAAGNALYGPLPGNGLFAVVLDASATTVNGGSKSRLQCTWKISTSPVTTYADTPCKTPLDAMLPEGTFPLKLSVTDTKTSVTKTVNSSITVRNTLLSILGDSYASGEGFPPFRNPDGTIDWDEPACDRSRWSGFVRSALTLEKSDPRSNVTVVDVACSGGEILEQPNNPAVSPNGGLLSPQKKIKQPSQQSNTGPGDYMPPQIDQLAAIAGGQTYDAGLMSIGGNDAGLSPVIISCVATDVLPVVINGFPDSGISGALKAQIQGFPNCQDGAQVSGKLDLANLQDIEFTCETNGPSGSFKDLGGLLTLIGDMNLITPNSEGGYRCLTSDPSANVPVQDNPELEEAVFNNLEALQVDYGKLAPCLGATGGAAQCQTQKLVNGVPQPGFTASDPVRYSTIGNLTQAMYPDLTQKGTPGNTEFCGVQQGPTQPWGGQLTLKNPAGLPEPDNINFPTMEQILTNPLMSPLNQIDNAWAFNVLYEGQAGHDVIAVPQNTSFPSNVPALSPVVTGFGPFDPSAAPQPAPNTRLDNRIEVPVNGLVAQIRNNGATYGWNTAFSMYDASHPYGMCSPNRWVTSLTDYIVDTTAAKGTGVGFHPNDVGQQQYANMLSATLLNQVPPVARAFTTLKPLGDSVSSKIRVKLLSPAAIKPGKHIRLQVKVMTKGKKKGTIGVRAVSTKAVLRYTSVNLPKDGTRKISLPKKWSKVGKNGKVNVTVQFLGNISVEPSNKGKVTQYIGRAPK